VNTRVPIRKSAHTDPAILFGLGGVTFAINAKEVDEIRDTGGLVPPGADAPSPKVRFRLTRDRKTYWVIEASEHFHMPQSRSARVLVLRNANVAVLVDKIDRMTEIGSIVPLPRAFRGEERGWYRGLAILGDSLAVAVPVVDPQSFTRIADKHHVGELG
jgi:chemotaxis signal transduction protein